MRPRAARWIATAAGSVAASGALAVACVLVEPPAELPAVVKHRPLILHPYVTPPTTEILESWPSANGFNIPIEVLDPDAVIAWHAFIDYDRVDSLGFVGGELGPDPASDDGGVRTLPLSLAPPADVTACHTIEVLVANSFVENHTPDSIGGDSVTWFYAPSGSLDDCPLYDAGSIALDASDSGGTP